MDDGCVASDAVLSHVVRRSCAVGDVGERGGGPGLIGESSVISINDGRVASDAVLIHVVRNSCAADGVGDRRRYSTLIGLVIDRASMLTPSGIVTVAGSTSVNPNAR